MTGLFKKIPILITASLLFTACATSKVPVTSVNIEPVEQVKSDPFNPDHTFELAEKSFLQEDYKAALTSYAQVFAYDPDHVGALFGQAQSHLALGQYEKAARLYWEQDWTELDAGRVAKKEIGKILSGVYTNRYAEPIKAINDGMMLSPNDARLWNAKGQYHDRQNEWMEALSAYLEAMKTGNWLAGTINNMGMSLLLQDRLSEARSKFEQALELQPDNAVYDNNLRMTYILEGDVKAALDDLKDARAADVLNDAGYVALKRNKTALAQLLFEKALDISPVFHTKAQANLETLRQSESAARSKAPARSP